MLSLSCVFLLLISTTSHAEVYRCVDENGIVTFIDRSCADGSAPYEVKESSAGLSQTETDGLTGKEYQQLVTANNARESRKVEARYRALEYKRSLESQRRDCEWARRAKRNYDERRESWRDYSSTRDARDYTKAIRENC